MAEGRLSRAQRSHSRKNRGSNGRRKARSEVRRRHAAVVRQRASHLHQASARPERRTERLEPGRSGPGPA